MKKLFLVIPVLALTLVVAVTVRAQMPTAPPPYTPPHPYPLPDDAANFPQPGNVVKYYTGGFTVDQINDQAKYFRSDTFTTQMRSLYGLAQTDTCGPNVASQFDVIKRDSITAINDHMTKLTQKRDQILNEGSLNDVSTSGPAQAPYDHAKISGIVPGKDTVAKDYSPVDLQLQLEVMTYYNKLNGILQGYLSDASQSQTCDDLKGVLGQAQNFKNTEENRNEFKSLAVRVFGERLNYWSEYLQSIMAYDIDCVAPYLDDQMGTNNPAGLDAYKKYVYGVNINYVFGKDARLYDDWYSTVVINDQTYRPFTKFNYQLMDSEPTAPVTVPYESKGAREEYRLASQLAKSSTCIGAPTANCRDGIHMHMRAAKYLLQDIFHVIWWEYDNLLLFQEQGNTLSINNIIQYCESQGYKLPEQRFQNSSGTQPSGFPAAAWSPKPTRVKTR